MSARRTASTESEQPAPLAVVLASAGRAALLAEVVDGLRQQTVPFELVISVPDESSLPPAPVLREATVVLARGLAAQRNAGIDACPEHAIVFMFDDDAVVRSDYLERASAVFSAHPDVVALTGRVLLDGAIGAVGEVISAEDASAALRDSTSAAPTGVIHGRSELYGCNFAFVRDRIEGERFDERLPLYSWLEDHDFARRVLRHGRVVRADDCVIVHRGVKSGGRAAHVRLGYSQMMNPLYLVRKGSFPVWLAVREIVPRCGKNLLLAVAGRESPWRRERLRGNTAALRDAVRGRIEPEGMLRF